MPSKSDPAVEPKTQIDVEEMIEQEQIDNRVMILSSDVGSCCQTVYKRKLMKMLKKYIDIVSHHFKDETYILRQ